MKTVLLIEDNKDVRENITEILELASYKVFAAENGKVGVDIALKESPDIIICDIMMPELDGYGVLHMLNKNPATSGIPFIFLTAKAERTDYRKGMEMGADDYLTKPFDDIELLNAIEVRLKKASAMKETSLGGKEGIENFIKAAGEHANIKLTSDERDVIHFKKKHIIYAQAQRPSSLFYVVKGKVKTFRMNDDGKELITGIYTDGEFFGYTPILEETTYQDHAEVLDDAEVMLIPRADFMQLVSSDVQTAKRFIKLLSSNLSEREEKLIQLAYNSLRKRVADGLIMVYEKFRRGETDSPKIGLSREDLAQVVGTATESLIRTLSDFKSEKLIDIRDGKIHILNEGKLKNLLN